MDKFEDRFFARVFTIYEREKCIKRRNRGSCFAKRYAAKEAFSKAIGTGFRNGVYWRDIGVVNDKSYGLRGHTEQNDVSELFFSQANINYLQDKIIEIIFNTLNTSIEKQSEMYLLQIMRTIYMESRLYDPNYTREIIEELNQRVLDKCIPEIETNTKLYKGYIEDITTPIKVLDRPGNLNVKGFNQLENDTERLSVYNDTL